MSVDLAPLASQAQQWPKARLKAFILQELALRTCQVVWTLSSGGIVEASGCFIKGLSPEQVQVITYLHDRSWSTAKVAVIYGSQKFKARLDQTFCTPELIKGNLCVLGVTLSFEAAAFEFKGTFFSPYSLGEKVYFSGIPCAQQSATAHQGRIVSPQASDAPATCIIDGATVRGHTGGPVVIWRDHHQLELLGIIRSYLTGISKQLTEVSLFSNMHPLQKPDADDCQDLPTSLHTPQHEDSSSEEPDTSFGDTKHFGGMLDPDAWIDRGSGAGCTNSPTILSILTNDAASAKLGRKSENKE